MLTLEETAERLGVSQYEVRRLIAQHKLSRAPVEGKIRFYVNEVDNLHADLLEDPPTRSLKRELLQTSIRVVEGSVLTEGDRRLDGVERESIYLLVQHVRDYLSNE